MYPNSQQLHVASDSKDGRVLPKLGTSRMGKDKEEGLTAELVTQRVGEHPHSQSTASRTAGEPALLHGAPLLDSVCGLKVKVRALIYW